MTIQMLTLGASLKKHSSEYFENSTLFNYLFLQHKICYILTRVFLFNSFFEKFFFKTDIFNKLENFKTII